jgi:hypothetical protein
MTFAAFTEDTTEQITKDLQTDRLQQPAAQPATAQPAPQRAAPVPSAAHQHARPSYAPEAGPRYTCGACRSPLFRVERTAAERRIENSRRMRCSASACGWEGLLTSTAVPLDNRGAAEWAAAGTAPQRSSAAPRLRKRSLLLPVAIATTMLAGLASGAVLAWQAFGGTAAATYTAPVGPVAVGVAADGLTLTSPSLGANGGLVLEAVPAAAGK